MSTEIIKNDDKDLKLIDLEGVSCVFFKDDVLVYNILYYIKENEQGFYAYSEKENVIIDFRNELIKNKHFKPTELTIFKMQNIPAILKKRRTANHV